MSGIRLSSFQPDVDHKSTQDISAHTVSIQTQYLSCAMIWMWNVLNRLIDFSTGSPAGSAVWKGGEPLGDRTSWKRWVMGSGLQPL